MKDLTCFAGDCNSRYDTEKPFVRGGFRYATNAKIAVRQPTDQPDTPDIQLPKLGLETWFKEASCTEPWPVPEVRLGGCEECNGVKCYDAEIGGRTIAGYYALLIYLLGGVTFDPSGAKDKPLSFQIGDIEGRVMPIFEGGSK